MKENGKTINNMAKDLKHGQIDLNMKVIMLKERNKVMVNFSGQMVIN